jgi:hypothetical protein
MCSVGLGALHASCALHWGNAGCNVDMLPEVRWCHLIECSFVGVQLGTLMPAALCLLLSCVASAALMLWQRLLVSLHCLHVGVTIQLTFTMGDFIR